MGGALVDRCNSKPSVEQQIERRKLIARELDIHGGRPIRVAQSLGVSLVSLQRWIAEVGLRGEAKKARDRWARMFTLGGGKDEEEHGETEA